MDFFCIIQTLPSFFYFKNKTFYKRAIFIRIIEQFGTIIVDIGAESLKNLLDYPITLQ